MRILIFSRQALDLFDFEKNGSFLNWKLELMRIVGDFHLRMRTSYPEVVVVQHRVMEKVKPISIRSFEFNYFTQVFCPTHRLLHNI